MDKASPYPIGGMDMCIEDDVLYMERVVVAKFEGDMYSSVCV